MIFGFEPIRVSNWGFLIEWVINEIEVYFGIIGCLIECLMSQFGILGFYLN